MPRPFNQLPSSVFATGIAPHKNIFRARNNDFLLQNDALINLVPSLTSNVYGCVLTTTPLHSYHFCADITISFEQVVQMRNNILSCIVFSQVPNLPRLPLPCKLLFLLLPAIYNRPYDHRTNSEAYIEKETIIELDASRMSSRLAHILTLRYNFMISRYSHNIIIIVWNVSRVKIVVIA